MRFCLPLILIIFTSVCNAQKYALIDKKMTVPVTFTNNVTTEHNYKNLFAVETNNLTAFIAEVEKIAKKLDSKTAKAKAEAFDFSIGSTKFIGLKVPLSAEQRLDVVLITDCGNIKTSMHLSDAKSSNSVNAYFIQTWLKYIRSYIK